MLRALASVIGEVKPANLDDKAIRDRVLTELAKEKWAPSAMVDVVVRNGVVNLWGAITDERERQALVVAAENVPGVKQVKDHVAWVEPMTGTVFQSADEAELLKAS